MKTTTRSWLAMIVIGIFTIMANLDASIINIALPIMSKSLAVPISQITYTVMGYMVILSGLLVTFGKLGDIWGKGRIFTLGMYSFTIGSLMASVNFGFEFLLLARFVQAVGAAATLSNSYGLISELFDNHTRGTAMGINTMFISAGFVAGPALGGFLLQQFAWNAIFMINIPLGIIAIILGHLFLPKNHGRQQATKLDGWGAGILFIITLALTLYFIYLEKQRKNALLPLSIFKNRTFSLALLVGMLIPLINALFSFIFPLYLQDYLNWSVGTTGILMLIFPLIMAIAAPLGGWLSDLFSQQLVLLTGLVLIIITQIGFLFLDSHTSLTLIISLLISNGIGTGFFIAPNNTLLISVVPQNQLGVAGSLQSLGNNIGNILGVALGSLALFTTMSIDAGYRVSTYLPAHPAWFAHGLTWSFSVSLICALLGFAISIINRPAH
ncbi:MFS transporter [Lactiplantibacillus plantarum]|uniref:MFS transporter n=1 Tax=Lactiplantibacillus plantarum TaxID=1590 RepID=UPI00077728BF|nr:MFS transporter [Lactiplantibacillus plantarum]AMO28640.1 MFS transporter [Lactiplantibacillus plantarum]AZU40433.1 MFS transporter [Lactiplantibacillus plantarum]MBO3685495.1 MFS transporter [Lactiplantibacillus plantarum]MCI3956595.1 MFS transporter [Lactiplantibacillus plantarum]MCT0496244.1 MFS transporter [Lactiplantibacillus plantarum]